MTKFIDPNGDVVLFFTGDSPRLLVSSKVLCLASPVFTAMFSRHFREGHSLSSTGSTEISLPDDPPLAMETIAKILHFRHDLVSMSGLDDLFDVALMADKYDLANSLGPWRQVWLRFASKHRKGFSGQHLYREIFIRYVFRDRPGFLELTKQAILWGNGVAEEEEYEAMPDRIMEAISDARIRGLEALIALADKFRLEYQAPGFKCNVRPPVSSAQAMTCGAAILGSLIRHYSNIGIFPTPLRPYYNLRVTTVASEMGNLECFVDLKGGHGVCSVKGQMVAGAQIVMDSLVGLDIDYFGKGATQGEKNTIAEALAEGR